MSPAARLLVGFAALLYLAIGLGELLAPTLEFAHKASAWQVLFRDLGLPEPLWDVAWVAVGLLAAAGQWSPPLARAAFYAGGVLFGMWACGSLLSWVWGYGATLPMTLALGYVALLQVAQAHGALERERLLERAARLDLRISELKRHVEWLEQRKELRP